MHHPLYDAFAAVGALVIVAYTLAVLCVIATVIRNTVRRLFGHDGRTPTKPTAGPGGRLPVLLDEDWFDFPLDQNVVRIPVKRRLSGVDTPPAAITAITPISEGADFHDGR